MHISGGTIAGDQIKVKPESEISIPLADYIRHIVREEMAAQKGRPEVIKLSDEQKQAITDYVKLKPTI